MKIAIVLCILVVFAASYVKSSQYYGYKLYRVAFDKGQEEQLRAIVNKIAGTEFWLFSKANGIADIFTAPHAEKQLLSVLEKNGFVVSLSNDDLQSSIEDADVVIQ